MIFSGSILLKVILTDTAITKHLGAKKSKAKSQQQNNKVSSKKWRKCGCQQKCLTWLEGTTPWKTPRTVGGALTNALKLTSRPTKTQAFILAPNWKTPWHDNWSSGYYLGHLGPALAGCIWSQGHLWFIDVLKSSPNRLTLDSAYKQNLIKFFLSLIRDILIFALLKFNLLQLSKNAKLHLIKARLLRKLMTLRSNKQDLKWHNVARARVVVAKVTSQTRHVVHCRVFCVSAVFQRSKYSSGNLPRKRTDSRCHKENWTLYW